MADAAGLVDPVTAEGISHAIRSGQLAATVFADCRLDVSEAGKLYQSLLETEILRELRAGRVLANVLYNYPRFRNWAFRVFPERGANRVGFIRGSNLSFLALNPFQRPAGVFGNQRFGIFGRLAQSGQGGFVANVA